MTDECIQCHFHDNSFTERKAVQQGCLLDLEGNVPNVPVQEGEVAVRGLAQDVAARTFPGNEPEMQKEENGLKYTGHFITHFGDLLSDFSGSQKLKNMEIWQTSDPLTLTPKHNL